MTPLLLAALAILAAPIFDRALRGRLALSVAVHDLARVAVFGVVAVHMLPHGIAVAGAVAIPAVLAGVFAASLLERPLESRDGASWIPVAAALALHQAIDGVALAQPDDGPFLPVAVILHTIPIALLAWRFSSLRGGPRSAAVTLGGMIAATVAGYAIASMGPGSRESALASLVECFLGGALVHVLAHRHDEASRDRPLASGLGTLAGIAVVGTLLWMHPTPRRFEGELSLDEAFLALATAIAPPILMGGAMVATLRGRLPNRHGIELATLAAVGVILGPVAAVVALVAGLIRVAAGRGEPEAAYAGDGHHGAHTHHTHHGAHEHDAAHTHEHDAAHTHSAHTHEHDAAHQHPHDAAHAHASEPHEHHDAAAFEHAHHDAATRTAALPLLRGALDDAAPWALAGLIVAAIAEPSLDAAAFATVPPVALAAALGVAAWWIAPSPLAALPLGVVLAHKGAPPALIAAAIAVCGQGLPAGGARRATAVVAGLVVGLVGASLAHVDVPLHDPRAFGDGRVALAVLTLAALDLLRRRGLDAPVAQVLGAHDHPHG
jgi:hypothetical protein